MPLNIHSAAAEVNHVTTTSCFCIFPLSLSLSLSLSLPLATILSILNLWLMLVGQCALKMQTIVGIPTFTLT